jgi:hypothetical protein
MTDNCDPRAAVLPAFDERQWQFLLHADALMEQVIRHTATLEVLIGYYHDIAAALQRCPSSELRALQASTITRIHRVTADAAIILAQVEQEATWADPEATHRVLRERLMNLEMELLSPVSS